MSLDQLQAVVTIAEEGTLVRAARRLHISQPPLTRKVRALEDELGVALFDRGPGGMRPTAAGERLLQRARGILAEVERAAVEARAEAQRTGPRAGSA
ncbi:MAG: LysR family transcriptional regulator, partial [Myxococcota bacterium]